LSQLHLGYLVYDKTPLSTELLELDLLPPHVDPEGVQVYEFHVLM
jgi:hypothetical protein